MQLQFHLRVNEQEKEYLNLQDRLPPLAAPDTILETINNLSILITHKSERFH